MRKAGFFVDLVTMVKSRLQQPIQSKYICLAVAACSVFGYSTAAIAMPSSDWDTVRERGLQAGKIYDISSGTGFFVAPNYIVTNEHVVEQCLTISIRGSVAPAAAKLVAVDKEHDLALLLTSSSPKLIAKLRSNGGLKPNDMVAVIGYPLQHAKTGTYTSAQAKILNLENLQTQDNAQIEFTAVLERGNSGGPLIDSVGNVIGVVQARKNYYYVASEDNTGVQEPFKTSGVAIGLGFLKPFLTKNGIAYQSNYSSDIMVSYQAYKSAADYIVNVHCVK